jgi:hypothetical protein
MDWLIFYNFKRPHLGLKKDVEAVYCTYGIFKTISSNVSYEVDGYIKLTA